MTADIENIILEQLRVIRGEITDLRTETRERLDRVELRLGVIEHRLSVIESRLADAEITTQKRLDRIERRLELTE